MKPELARRLARRKEVLERVKRILIDQLKVRRDPDEIDPDVTLFGTGLGLDSVDAVELVVSLESEFKIRFPSQPGQRAVFRTVNTLVDMVLEMTEPPRGSR